MTEPAPDSLEQLWERLLSRQPEIIQLAYQGLSVGEQQYIYNHLTRMSSESGWHPEQRLSAQIAIQAIDRSV